VERRRGKGGGREERGRKGKGKGREGEGKDPLLLFGQIEPWNCTCVPDCGRMIIPLHVPLELKWQAVLIVLRNILRIGIVTR